MKSFGWSRNPNCASFHVLIQKKKKHISLLRNAKGLLVSDIGMGEKKSRIIQNTIHLSLCTYYIYVHICCSEILNIKHSFFNLLLFVASEDLENNKLPSPLRFRERWWEGQSLVLIWEPCILMKKHSERSWVGDRWQAEYVNLPTPTHQKPVLEFFI